MAVMPQEVLFLRIRCNTSILHYPGIYRHISKISNDRVAHVILTYILVNSLSFNNQIKDLNIHKEKRIQNSNFNT